LTSPVILTPRYLPENFVSYAVFFELLAEDAEKDILQDLFPNPPLRGFSGALILRGEHLAPGSTGKISWLISETAIAPLGEKLLLNGYSISAGLEYGPKSHLALALDWMEPNFAWFAFELLAVMTGRHPGRGRVASFHGTSFYNPGSDPQK
jgi:hypothetical protein